MHFKTFKASIWPEYDEPGVFVNLEGEMADDVKLPVTLTFNLPKGAEVNSTCAIDANGQHTLVPNTLSTGDNPTVTYTVDTKATHIEFYYQPFDGSAHRQFTYKVHAPGLADDLQVEVQRPLRANNFTVTPASKQVLSDTDGFQYHTYDYGRVAAGQEITFSIAYDKTDANPSVERQQDPVTGSASSEYALPALLIGLGIVMVAMFVFLRGRQRTRPLARRVGNGRSRAAVGRPGQAAALKATGARFCTRCGAPLHNGAAFCSACGTPARRQG